MFYNIDYMSPSLYREKEEIILVVRFILTIVAAWSKKTTSLYSFLYFRYHNLRGFKIWGEGEGEGSFVSK